MIKLTKKITTVFLDRDGVINVDSPEYIKNPEEFNFIENSLQAFKLLNDNALKIIVITNQAMIGRNISTEASLKAIFEKMEKGIRKAGGDILDIVYCPHHPDDGCDCRKPKPGMILSAAEKHGIDLTASVMIGDSAKDIECGKTAGCGMTILVETGNGKKAFKVLTEKNSPPDFVAKNLYDAVRRLLSID